MHTTSLPITLNRSGDAAFTLPADGWVHLAPYGEQPAPMQLPGGREVAIVQVLDRAAADGLAARFRESAAAVNFPGLLVDFDHFSHDTDKSTRAAGWIEEVAARDDGLWGRVKFSASGKAALEGGDYRLFSPVLGFAPGNYTPGARVTPVALLRGALTNDPRLKGMVPISNRLSPESSHTMDYKAALLTQLGLPPDSTDEAIQAAITSQMNEVESRKTALGTAHNRITALETELIGHDLDRAGLQGEARTAATALLTKNRTEGLAFIAALGKQGSGYAPVHNRNGKQAPSFTPGADDTGDLGEKRRKAIGEHQIANRCSYDVAFHAVRAAQPALFVE
ncbi:MAG: hypothetical protein H2169_09300 [Opitutus sp.]|nr:hypothetical protein [Opitutus sp.]